MRRAARQRLGRFYDTGFNLWSQRQFCSRFVREVLQEATAQSVGDIETFADLLARMKGRPAILSRDKILDARQRYWICDSTRASADLGFEAQTSLREGVAATLEWYRQAQWLTY